MQKTHKDKADVLRVIRERHPELTSRFTVRRMHRVLCEMNKSGEA